MSFFTKCNHCQKSNFKTRVALRKHYSQKHLLVNLCLERQSAVQAPSPLRESELVVDENETVFDAEDKSLVLPLVIYE